MRKFVLTVLALMLTVAFAACSGNPVELNAFNEPVHEESLFEREPEREEPMIFTGSLWEASEAVIEGMIGCDCGICRGDIEFEPHRITPIADGNVVDFHIQFVNENDTCGETHGVLVLELGEGLALARSPQTFSNLMMVYNPENGRIVFIGFSKRDDVILRLTFEGEGMWTLINNGDFSETSIENFEFTGEIKEIEEIEEIEEETS
jgi:hypothetical protein